MLDLLPDETAAIAKFSESRPRCWKFHGPTLLELPFRKVPAPFGTRMVRELRKRVEHGFSLPDPWVRKVKNFLKRKGVQVILGEYLNISHPFLTIAAEMNIPFWVHGHGYDISRLLKDRQWQKKYLEYNDAAGIITINRVSKKRLEDLGIQHSKIHIVPYGVNVSEHFPRMEMDRAASQESTIRCLAVGRMVAKKAPILLLDSFRRAVENAENLRLDYVGSGEMLQSAMEYVSASGLEKHVTFYGVRNHEEVLRLMRTSDIFIQHSVTDSVTGDEEGLPVAILEAMANGLPVVSTRHAGIPEAVEEQVSGFLVDERDTAAMGDHIVALAAEPRIRLEFGKHAWEIAKEKFSWGVERKALRDLLGC